MILKFLILFTQVILFELQIECNLEYESKTVYGKLFLQSFGLLGHFDHEI